MSSQILINNFKIIRTMKTSRLKITADHLSVSILFVSICINGIEFIIVQTCFTCAQQIVDLYMDMMYCF